MENALRACCKGIKIGKILIHREGDNGQQVSQLYSPLETFFSCNPESLVLLSFSFFLMRFHY